MTKICSLATQIAGKVREDSGFYIFTKSQVCKIICEAIKANRLDINSLEEKVQREVRTVLATR